ncbi:DUF7919 family protein [Enhygromyxa salina]|uniref:DUF7919 domain-containing protein n=1 Tax=Enhygromyxa salina TaxID=215803 RepID=A0A2S9YC12_9BACT|nr:hypothetical protein ENSA7_54680 [Enhygromyxa salina]
MRYSDLSKYSYTKLQSKASLLNVGWVDRDVPFLKGSIPAQAIARIESAIPLHLNAMRGVHGCPFCGDRDIYTDIDGKRTLLGMSEIWIPSTVSETVYIAPSLLLHYIRDHQYMPPREVVDALLALPCDPARWNTPGGSYSKLVKRYG